MGNRDDDYKFLQIVDAIASINQKVNIIGVVTETGIPRQSRGTDCFVTVRIIDESRPSPGLAVNFFAETMDKLPHVTSAGDILQLSNVVMKTHGVDVYALFSKKFSSFALFEGKHGTTFVPYQHSSKFKAREDDKKFVSGLREWWINRGIETGSNDFLYLREINDGKPISLFCKIVHLCEVKEDEWMLLVWDGTDTPPVYINSKLDDPLPLHLEPFDMPRDILCTFPAVGSILRVFANQEKEKLGLNFLKVGRWVLLVNIKCEVQAGLWRAMLLPSTRLCNLPDDSVIAAQLEGHYEERVQSPYGRMPFSSFPWPSDLTETDHQDASFCTLMDILTYPKVTAKFRCVVRVVAAFPWKAEHFVSSGIYVIRLTLEDPTARIHAYLCQEDGIKFFGGYHSVDELARKRNMLLGISDSFGSGKEDAQRYPPWIDCCLKSFYTDKSDIWGTRTYRIFGTRLME